ncbi:DNA-directed RNA polymerase [uncultured Pseudosulfitobacter sp.]|uniref:DNA-directed RNA polymerase n=1 Tax=uncultured Pseudosulfitobacter sp. TaxID=2854214 RepID=UPI0030DAA5A2|tara:strand:+ start:15171 stop:17633 length:2463 start_codon:yes stop_codon:yes gene_type:complete
MTIDLYQEELRLEAMARDMGVNRFNEDLSRKRETQQESSTYYGSALMKRSVVPMIEALTEFTEAAKKGVAGRRHNAVKFLALIPLEVAAYLTSKCIIDTLSRPMTAARLASKIGTQIEDEVRYADFQSEAPALFQKVMRQTQNSQDRHKRTVLMHTYQKHVAHWEGWKPSDKLQLGTKLLEVFIESTGFAELVFVVQSKNRTVNYVQPTEAIVKWMEGTRENASHLTPAYLPMVVRPDPWTSPFNGGYHSPSLRPVEFVKTRNRAYLEELSSIPNQLSGVYEAVNAVQDVPWRINSKVMGVLTALWERGVAVAGLPARDEYVIAPYPFPDTAKEDMTDAQREELIDWKRKASFLHAANMKQRSQRIRAARTVNLANQFSKYDEIFFPHTLDFRGRVYAVPLFLNPQGADDAKGLLEFAEGKPIGSGTGPGWLAIQGANVFGYDKASLEERIDWVEEHQARILSSAADPLADMWWTEADKPWCFLAFCFEWTSYIQNGADHITHLPIAMDGSCSGLQHFSAALRDEVGGKAVNLTPADKPSDVYQEVADRVILKLRRDTSTSGTNATLAARILDFGVTRGTTKRATMTLPYGSTRFSCRSFVMEWIDDQAEKLERKGQQNPLKDLRDDAASLLAGYVWDAIGEVVIAARSAMDWLRETAKVLSSEGMPLHWTTPDGLPIMQEYRDMKARRVKTRFGDRFVYMTLQEEQDQLDSRRQANGVAPNWVHSMDGTHLRMAVLYAKDNGITNFAVIHDSFGTHACDTDLLGACLRESMVDLYEENVLEKFKGEVCLFLPTTGNIPDMPAFGKLDLSRIKESDYVFA